jgi:hypothetical protein
MSWKTGKYADPIVPEGRAVFTIKKVGMEETGGGTPYGQIMAFIDEFEGEYDLDDNSILAPEGQAVWGKVWFPKPEDSEDKALGKERRIRSFLEVIEYAMKPDNLDYDEDDAPSDIFVKNLDAMVGKSFRAEISHSVDDSGEYPTRAEINFFRVRRA